MLSLDVALDWIASFNDGERERFEASLHDEVVFQQRATDGVHRGAQEVAASFFGWRSGFLGLHGEISSAFGDADRVALEVIWSGIHRSSEKSVCLRACLLVAVRDGRVAEIVDYFDRLSFAEQLQS